MPNGNYLSIYRGFPRRKAGSLIGAESMQLHQASRQWSTRPSDQRFTSLPALAAFTAYQRQHSRSVVVSSRKLNIEPDGQELRVLGPNGHGYMPTHWAFGQLAQRAEAPAGYLRTLPAPMAADCLNYGLQFKREVDEIGCLLRKNGDEPEFAAATGPNYGRIWNAEIADMLVRKFGDGINGHWRVPGEFGKRIEVTTANTTLYASDRDMFVFLADEDRRIEIPNRRGGSSGSMARGFFVWNSEVGAQTIGAAFFLFDYACCNRIVWGAEQFSEVRIRHTSGAPDRWLEQVVPVLEEYATSSEKPIVEAIQHAQERRVEKALDKFLANRFGKGLVSSIKTAFEADEHRPIETVFDVVTGATAYARSITHQDRRVQIERQAGELLIPMTAARELVAVR